MSPDEMARKVAEAIANLGNPNMPRKMYQPPGLSERFDQQAGWDVCNNDHRNDPTED